MTSRWTNHLSVLGGGNEALVVDDSLVTGQVLHLSPGETYALTEEEGKSASPDEPGGPVWGPGDLPLAAHILRVSADAVAAEGEAAFVGDPELGQIEPGDTVKIELVGGTHVDLGSVVHAVELAAEPAGDLIIEFIPDE